MQQYHIGIDFGGTAIKAGVVDADYQIIAKGSIATRADHDFMKTVAEIAKLSGDVAAQAGLSMDDFSSVGIGCPSFIHPDTGRLVFVNNTNWVNVPLREELQKQLNKDVFVENDANCAVIGEALAGAAKGQKNVLLITLGTGVGSGLIINGKLFPGCDNMGAELGHTPFIAHGELCTCGIRGCFEAYASVTALIRQTLAAMDSDPSSMMHQYANAHGNRVTGRTAFDCARLGDASAKKVVDTYMDYIANGIGGFINIFRPDVVLIGGGISNEGDYLMDPINERLGQYVLAYDMIGAPKITAATLGNDAGIIGAAYCGVATI